MDSESDTSDEEGCYLCQPHLFKNADEEMFDESLQKECIENLRRKTRAELKKTQNKDKKMKLDNDLRMSYKYGLND